jgi:hypothetical protein
MCAAPFTPFESFTDDATPAISADFLNSIQAQGIAPAAAVAWNTRPRISCNSTDGVGIVLSAVPAVMCLDATTSKYGFATLSGQTVDEDNVPGGGGFSPASWHYAFCVLDNGVASVEVSTTEPDSERLIKNGDSTRRYLFAFYVDGGGSIVRFVREGFETRWQDRAHSYVFGSEGGGVGTFSTVGTNHDISTKRPPIAKFVDAWIYATAGGTAYTLTLSFIGDSDAQVRQIVAMNSEYTWTQRLWTGGQSFLFSDVTFDASSYGWIRVLGWVE